MKLAIIFAILFSISFMISQSAYATDWFWQGDQDLNGDGVSGDGTTWSDPDNWICFEFGTGIPIACPAPGYPDTLLTAEEEFVVISNVGNTVTVTIDKDVEFQDGSALAIESSTIKNSATLAINSGANVDIVGSTFTNSDSINNAGEFVVFTSTLNNENFLANTGVINIFSTATLDNSGRIDNTGGEINSQGTFDNTGLVCGGTVGPVQPLPNPHEPLCSALNSPPTTEDASVTEDEDTSHTFSQSEFPYDDADGDPLDSITIETLPSDGSLELNGISASAGQLIASSDISSLVYIPLDDDNGTPADSFSFTVSDGTDSSSPPNTMSINLVPVNDPPTAVVQNVVRTADSDCLALVTADDVDNGSSDPDGDSITLGLSPEGPFSLGSTTVTLTVTDLPGATDSEEATVTVEDNTSPDTTASLEPIDVKKKKGLFQVQVGAEDNCGDVSISADINGVPVENGDIVLLKLDAHGKTKVKEKSFSDRQCERFEKQADRFENRGRDIPDKLKERLLICEAGRLITIKDSSFMLTATAEDTSGNTSTATAEPEFESKDKPQRIAGAFFGKHDDEQFKTRGNYKIGDDRFRRVSGMGTFEITGDDKCNPLTAKNTLELGDGNSISMDVKGEICSKRFFSTLKGSFEVTGGTGDFEGAEGNGKISLGIGKKYFGGKISGKVSN